LDDSKIPAQGRKVRCSKCQHVFFVQKTPPPPPPPPEPEPEPDIDVRLDEAPIAPTPAPEPAETQEAFEPTVRIDLSAHHEELDFREEREASAPSPSGKRGIPKALVAVVAVLILLVAAGAVLWQMEMLPFLSSAPPEAPVAGLLIDQARLEGKWEKNAQVPRIFVINGVVKNASKKPKAFVKVRGLLLDKSGKTVKDVWAFCGNPTPAEELRTKAPAEIEKVMRNREGAKGTNRQLAPEATIPFSVVFFDVPEGVESFGAEVIEAQIPGAAK